VTLGPGQSSATVAVEVVGDTVPEDHEYVVVTVHDVTGAEIGGFWGLGFAVIVDDDQETLVPGTASLREGSGGGPTLLEVPLALSGPSDKVVTASWTTIYVPGAAFAQAEPGVDYVPVSGVVTLPPGQTQTSVTIEVDADGLVEADELVVVSFTDPTNARMGGFWGLGLGTVLDDDYVQMIVGSASVVEGTC
jgi:hypothetical protein